MNFLLYELNRKYFRARVFNSEIFMSIKTASPAPPIHYVTNSTLSVVLLTYSFMNFNLLWLSMLCGQLTPNNAYTTVISLTLRRRSFSFIGRVSYNRIYLCYFCFRWKTVSLVKASMQHLMHHATVSLQQSKITLQNNCINNTSITQPTLSF